MKTFHSLCLYRLGREGNVHCSLGEALFISKAIITFSLNAIASLGLWIVDGQLGSYGLLLPRWKLKFIVNIVLKERLICGCLGLVFLLYCFKHHGKHQN